MKYLVLPLLVLSLSTFAADKKMKSLASSTVKNDETRTLDITPQDKTDEIADKTATLTDAEFVKAEVTCKTKDGHQFKEGDSGYKECLKKAKADLQVKFKK